VSECYVYVIGVDQGPVKVGISNNPLARLSVLRTGSPFDLKLIYFREARSREHAHQHERNFHEDYADKRLSGEWFDMPGDFAAEGVDISFDTELYFEEEDRREACAAALNIWCEPNGAYA